ncbi:MAG: cation:proton antiporter [Candidatus Micrarchaeota archaeon]
MGVSIFVELAGIFIVTVALAGVARFLKQPLIVSYIVSGIVVGPVFLDLVRATDTIAAFAQIGVAFLLFIVGLSLNPRVIKEVGKVSLVTGVGQVVFTSVIGFFILKLLGFSTVVSLYVSVALTFSSTIIIMKLLSDKRDLETLYGRIAIGFLIVQDLIAIVILIVLSSIPSGAGGALELGHIASGLAVLVALPVLGFLFLPRVINAVAKSQEFLLLFSIGWCLAIAAAFHYLNFSVEAGALLAGVMLSFSPYNQEISFKVRPLRDFFIVLFFILLGSQMIFDNITLFLIPSVVLSAFILIGNPLIVIMLMGALGYTKRNSFRAGLTVAQISEFSLVLIALGVTLGHLTGEILSLVTIVGLVTITGSTYMILNSDALYACLAKPLSLFERKGRKVDELKFHKEGHYDVVLFGYNRIGFDVMDSIKKIKREFLVVDYDPAVITRLADEGIDCQYGDANDLEMLDSLSLQKVKMAVSTIPSFETNSLLVKKIRHANKKAIIIVVSHQIEDALRLYEQGATYVLLPHFLGGRHASMMIEKHKLDSSEFLKAKKAHIKHLELRKLEGHEHPRHERAA